MENIDYTIKNIDKLDDLKGHEWEYKNAEFILEFGGLEHLFLKQKNGICSNGKFESLRMRAISLLNLSELEFYGLKVILNEKPKLTRKERDFLECHEDIYIARGINGELYVFASTPEKGSHQWWLILGDCKYMELSDGIFDFISWESGKAWGKTELMELEVVE